MDIKDDNEAEKFAIIVGAGPAGLTAAYELLTKTNIKPIILEKCSQVGGISKTVDYKGWRFDIGPHRFFTKSPLVSALWKKMLPEESGDFLRIDRLTRIYYHGKFFDYPVNYSWQNLKNLGPVKIRKIIFSYLSARLKPIRPEISLEDFFINRFGKELYYTFFQSYTKKIWGMDCDAIPKSWGAQRIKSLSLYGTLKESLIKNFSANYQTQETSLINNFLYPKFGAGQMYEAMADAITKKGGIIKLNTNIKEIKVKDNKVISLVATNLTNQKTETYCGDYYFSSQALNDLIAKTDTAAPEIKEISAGLVYRNLILVALIYKNLNLNNQTKKTTNDSLISDNWIYIQDEGVKMGRLDIFNNFSPSLLKESDKVWLGAEYFCSAGDEFWTASDEDLLSLAKKELHKIGIASENNFLDGTVYRQAQAYPAYFGTYNRLGELKNYLNKISNLFLIGRNGLHRYNNMDHSILSAITAVNNIITNRTDKNNIWEINSEDQYHE
jgi:protoporphyrinogen oxidase